eukprot:TRINITY_DN4179_c0_g1_i1.p1 TRINITY_DN4179_c0_g1~~TRINITY_DN4179_c0_g1_i1.p1  ORF type:complete len:676 (+),score=192.53 TRINITY_DN4179_c0_g1_i1:83-2110(+)
MAMAFAAPRPLRLLPPFALLLALVIAALSPTAHADHLPGYDFAGRGCDVTKIAFGGNFLEGGIRNPVVALKTKFVRADTQPADTDWNIPTNTYTNFYPRCDWSNLTSRVHAAKEYQHELSNAFSAGVGFEVDPIDTPDPDPPSELTAEVASTLTVTYRETTKITLNYDEYIFDSRALCQQYSLNLKMGQSELVPKFIEAVLALPVEFEDDEQGYRQLIKDYGTHTVEGFLAGGMLTQRVQMTSYNYTYLQTEGVDVDMEASVSFGATVGAGVGTSTTTNEYREFAKKANVFDVVMTGGNQSFPNDFYRWSASIPSNPLPLMLHVRPIFEYITPELFGTTTDYVTDRAASVNRAIQFYLQTSASLPSLLPVFETASDTGGKWEGEVIAKCPRGYRVVGGACKGSGTSVDRCESGDKEKCWPWRITRSIPYEDESWLCRVGEDYGTKEYDRSVRGMALCLKEDVQTDMAPPAGQGVHVEVRTEQCTGNGLPNALSSKCYATCPDDFQLTGGGCEPTTLFPNDGSHHPDQVAVSAPAMDRPNTWMCGTRYDSGTGRNPLLHSSFARGFALCARWKSTLEYRPAVYEYAVERCSSGSTNDFVNFCSVQCPYGHVMVGGGCDAWGAGDSGDAWRLSKSWPYNNGWRCLGGEDYSSKVYQQPVYAYAICMRLNPNDDTPTP